MRVVCIGDVDAQDFPPAKDAVFFRACLQQQVKGSFLELGFVMDLSVDEKERNDGVDDQDIKGVFSQAFVPMGAGFVKSVMGIPVWRGLKVK